MSTDTVPKALETERDLLGACLVGPDRLSLLGDTVTPEMFWLPEHGTIFGAMLRVRERGQAVDERTVTEALAQAGDLERIGGRLYLSKLTDGMPRSSSLQTYADVIADRWARREAIAVCRQQAECLRDTDAELTAVLADLIGGVQPLAISQQEPVLDAADGAAAVLRDFDAAAQGRDLGWTTGLDELDEAFRFRRGQLVAVGARTSKGKSSLCVQFATHLARTVPVLFVSAEMPADRVWHLAAQQQGRYNLATIERGGYLSDDDYHRMSVGVGALEGLRLRVVGPTRRRTMPSIRAHAVMYQQQQRDLGAVVVDYAGLLEPTRIGKNTPRWEAMAQLSRDLKVLATELRCVVIVAVQLNRESAERTEQGKRESDARTRLKLTRPRLHDFRDSGAFEQDADIALLLHWLDDAPEDGMIDVAKNREGRCGPVCVAYNGSNRLFVGGGAWTETR